jgi:hypothetical protein
MPSDKRLEAGVIEGATPPMRALKLLVRLAGGLSLGAVVRGAAASTTERQKSGLSKEHSVVLERYRAARALDWYIVAWLTLEVAGYMFGLGHVPSWILVSLASYRLVEIAGVFADAVLFERREFITRTGLPYGVFSIPRSIVHSVVLLGETILCFGILYYCFRDSLPVVSGAQDALVFSMGAMVGGAEGAEGTLRLLVGVQPLVGLLFAGLVLARLVNALPTISDVWEEEKKAGGS